MVFRFFGRKVFNVSEILGATGGLLHLNQAIAGYSKDAASLPAVLPTILPDRIQGWIRFNQIQNPMVFCFDEEQPVDKARFLAGSMQNQWCGIGKGESDGLERLFGFGDVGGQNQQVNIVGQAGIAMDHNCEATTNGIGDAGRIQRIDGP